MRFINVIQMRDNCSNALMAWAESGEAYCRWELSDGYFESEWVRCPAMDLPLISKEEE